MRVKKNQLQKHINQFRQYCNCEGCCIVRGAEEHGVKAEAPSQFIQAELKTHEIRYKQHETLFGPSGREGTCNIVSDVQNPYVQSLVFD